MSSLFQCRYCHTSIFISLFGKFRHENYYCKNRPLDTKKNVRFSMSNILHPDEKKDDEIEELKIFQDLNQFGIDDQEDDNDDHNSLKLLNDSPPFLESSPFHDNDSNENQLEISEIPNSNSRHLNNDLSTFAMSSSTIEQQAGEEYMKFQMKYINFQRKIGVIIHDGKFMRSVNVTASTSLLEISSITNTSNSEQQNSHGLSSILKTAVVNNTTRTKKGYPNTMDLIELFAYVKLNYL